jgi:hypothetical protein
MLVTKIDDHYVMIALLLLAKKDRQLRFGTVCTAETKEYWQYICALLRRHICTTATHVCRTNFYLLFILKKIKFVLDHSKEHI